MGAWYKERILMFFSFFLSFEFNNSRKHLLVPISSLTTVENLAPVKKDLGGAGGMGEGTQLSPTPWPWILGGLPPPGNILRLDHLVPRPSSLSLQQRFEPGDPPQLPEMGPGALHGAEKGPRLDSLVPPLSWGLGDPKPTGSTDIFLLFSPYKLSTMPGFL